jgi:hypothetical protein
MRKRYDSPQLRMQTNYHPEQGNSGELPGSRDNSLSANSVRAESVDHNKYKPISRHAESHRQLGVTQASRTNLFEQALSNSS